MNAVNTADYGKQKMKINDDMYEHYKRFVKDYINSICIEKGNGYTWTMFLRRGTLEPEFLTAVSVMFLYQAERKISKGFNFQITGLETGATPLLTGITLVAKMYFDVDINAFVVRKDVKEYGTEVEGLLSDLPVLIIDDLCNTAFSMKQCYDVVSQYNVKILPQLFSIVNVHDALKYMPDHKMISLYTLEDFGLPRPNIA
jgi:orotate phosphoribosyltransferase